MNQNIKIAVDAIVFGYDEKVLYVLLIKQKYGHYKGNWALPGGFVKEDEGLQNAVIRELKEETGVAVNYLEQLYTFGDDINRDKRFRVVSVAYFALVDSENFVLEADTDAEEVAWFPIQEIPQLSYDHNHIVAKAYKRLKNKLSYQPIGFDLLNKEFAFSDLENLYMTILNHRIDRRNFRKKIMSFGLLKETDKMQQIGSGRPAKLYRFNEQKYKELEKEGFHFEIKLA